MNWYPQALLTAEQAAAGAFFFEKQHAFFKKGLLLTKALIFSNISSYFFFLKHQIDAERIPMPQSCRTSSRTLIHTRLVTKAMSNICQYIIYV